MAYAYWRCYRKPPMIPQPASKSALLIIAGLLIAATVAGCASSPAGQADRVSGQPAKAATVGERAAIIALQQIGVPYRYGGDSTSGFDCSGLVQYAYRQAGRTVPRTTGQLWDGTSPVRRDALQPGDVLFFEIEGKMSHVGLYVGGGEFVHAPSSGRRVSVETLDSPFYAAAFLRAGRP